MTCTLHIIILMLFIANTLLMSWLGIKFFVANDPIRKPPQLLLTLIVAIAIILASKFIIEKNTCIFITQLLTIICYLCSITLMWWAYLSNKDKPLAFVFSRAIPKKLVTKGPYRWIRHPFYSSYIISWAALSIYIPGVFSLSVLFIMFFIYLNAAKSEENSFLSSPFRNAYIKYQESTGMFFPNLLQIKWNLNNIE